MNSKKIKEVWKMIRHKACLSIPNNHEYIKIPHKEAYECIHCKEIYVPALSSPQEGGKRE